MGPLPYSATLLCHGCYVSIDELWLRASSWYWGTHELEQRQKYRAGGWERYDASICSLCLGTHGLSAGSVKPIKLAPEARRD